MNKNSMNKKGSLDIAAQSFKKCPLLFANFSKAWTEARGDAQIESLKNVGKDLSVRKLEKPSYDSAFSEVDASCLKKGDFFLVKVNEQIPMDGEVIAGVASVDESTITGESAPVIRESGGERSGVIGGSSLVSDWLIVKVTAETGERFLDKMITMLERGFSKKAPQ